MAGVEILSLSRWHCYIFSKNSEKKTKPKMVDVKYLKPSTIGASHLRPRYGPGQPNWMASW
jgi:hypothetical protein